MIQINDESHNRRPIRKRLTCGNKKVSLETDQPEIGKLEDLQTLSPTEAEHLIACCISLININSIDSDTLHSCLRIILRLTRNHKMALWFAKSNGLDALFNLKESQGFNGFYSLISLLIRHILESPEILQTTIEKTIRQLANNGAAHSLSGISTNSTGRYEIYYLLRSLGPIACRSPALFMEALNSCVKVQLRPTRDDKTAESEEKALLEERLAYLMTGQRETNPKKTIQLLPEIDSVITNLVTQLYDQKKDNKMDTGSTDKKNDKKSDEPLITQNILLRILGEIVTSYPQCASSLTSYTLKNGESTLQYVLDNLLMNSNGKPESLALNFLSCFANCDSNKVQNKFVVELKSALLRVLQQPESLFKHQHLRALLG